MATESPSAGDSLKIFIDGQQIELIVRIRQSNPELHGQTLTDLAIATVGNWIRAWKAIKSDTWKVDSKSAEEQHGVKRTEHAEPYVTVFNKDWNGLSITVHSHENGQGAVTAAAAFLSMRDFIQDKTPQLFQAQSTKPSASPEKRDINNVDSFLNDPATHEVTPPQSSAKQGANSQAVTLPFRFFKRLAPSIIQLQEFVQGGNGKDKYQKSAIEATLPYHKNTPQYDEGAFVYYPITGAIQIKEGQYGKQAIIPTSKGRVYVDMEYDGKEKPEWAILSADFHNEYERLVNDDDAKLDAPNCVLVLKMSELKNNKQFKNYYHIYQALD